jgi:hypothetical protein
MSPAEVADMFQIFGECNEDWVEAEARFKVKESKKEKNKWMEGWFTRQQLLDKHGQDEEFVDGIIRNKLKNPKTWMPHPDYPESEQHRLYKAVDYISAFTEHEKEASKTMSQTAALEQATVMPLLSTFQMPLDQHGPSSSSSGPLAIQDGPGLDTATTPGQVAKPPELIAFEKAQQEKAEKLAKRKAELEAHKALPATQASKWEKMMGKNCNDCTGVIADIQGSKCPAEVKTKHVKEFRAMLKKLNAMRSSLTDCTDEEATIQRVAAAPVLEVEYKVAIKQWKKVLKVVG